MGMMEYQLFTRPFIQAQIKENIKAPSHWPLCGEFAGDRTQMASNMENVSIWLCHHDINHTQGTDFSEKHNWDYPIFIDEITLQVCSFAAIFLRGE